MKTEVMHYSFYAILVRRVLCVPSCLTLYASECFAVTWKQKSKHLPFCLEIIILAHAYNTVIGTIEVIEVDV